MIGKRKRGLCLLLTLCLLAVLSGSAAAAMPKADLAAAVSDAAAYVCAAAARLNISLCQGAEPLLVIPASHDTESLMSVPANQVYMKAGSSILELKKQLEEHGRLDRTSMVENCSMENEKVYEDFSKLEETSGYFSLVISKMAEGGKA